MERHPPHDVVLVLFLLDPLPHLDRAHEVRPVDRTAVRDDRGEDRYLEGGHLDRALADRDRDRLTRMPDGIARHHPLLPVGVRHRSHLFVREIDPALLSEAERVGPARDALDPHVVPQVVEVDVARLDDGLAHGERAVPSLADRPALVDLVAEAPRACAMVDPPRPGDAILERGDRHDDLEDRPRRELREGGAVLERMVRVADQRLPRVLREAVRERVRIEGGAGDHRQHRPGRRVEKDRRARLVAEGLLQRLLQVEVQSQA